MARKVKKTRTGINSSRKRNGKRSPMVQHSPQHTQETDDLDEGRYGTEDEGSRYERNDAPPHNSVVASPVRDEPSHVQTDDDEEESDELRKTRGPNRGMDVPENLEDRPIIFTIGGRFPDSRVTSDISVTITGNFEGPWATWRMVPPSMKELYWDKFKKHFKWHPTSENQIYKAWSKTCTNRFRDILCLTRKHAKKESGSKKAKDWIDLNPEWMNSTIWNKLIRDVWSTDKWQGKSDSGTKNRLNGNEKASPTYRGGSISISAHKLKMRKELKRDPTELELFDRIYKTDGEHACPKGKKVREKYDQLMEETYPDPESRPEFDHTIWSEASRGLSKKILYGFDDCPELGVRSLDNDALEKMIKLKTEECTKVVVVENLTTILPDMVSKVLEKLEVRRSRSHPRDDLEDDEYSDSYDSYDSYEDHYEINMEKSRSHRIYAKQPGKKRASSKINKDVDQHGRPKKHKKTLKH